MWKSRMLFLYAYLASALIIWAYEDKNIGFTLIYALSIMLFLCFIQAASAPFFIKISQSTERNVIFRGENEKIKIWIKNRGPFFYPRIRIAFYNDEILEYSETGAFPLGPGRDMEIDLSICFPYRGFYKAGFESVSVADFLGIFRFFVKCGDGTEMLVYPSIGEKAGLPVQNRPGDAIPNPDPYSEDYTSVADLRKYSESDSLKKIHWKLTARRGELIVKDFLPDNREGISFVLDLRPPVSGGAKEAAALEDKMLSYLASAASGCLNAGLRVRLYSADGMFFEAVPENEISPLLQTLARIEFRENAPPFAATDAPDGCTAAFLSHFDEEDSALLGEAAFADRDMYIYFFHNNAVPDTIERRLADLEKRGAAVSRIIAN